MELRETPITEASEIWEEITKKMVQVVWHYGDVIVPNRPRDVSEYFNEGQMSVLKKSLGITNLIDSLVGDLIDNGVEDAARALSNLPNYDDIRLYLSLQSASEIVHQKVYKLQFDLVTHPSERHELNDRCKEILQPLVDFTKDRCGADLLILCVSIECMIIPVVFKIINDTKSVDLSNYPLQVQNVVTTILATNRLILRDELLHVSGGSELIRQLQKLGIIRRSRIQETIQFVSELLRNIVSFLTHSGHDDQLLSEIEVMVQCVMAGRSIPFNDLTTLTFVKATMPSIDGFFRGSVTSYLNSSNEIVVDPVIE